MGNITRSYITTVLESYEYAARQVRHLARILPDHWELLFVDDGSVPEIPVPEERPKNTTVIRTGDTRDWSQDAARNLAARLARGEYILFADIDHTFTAAAIAVCDAFAGQALHFRRQMGGLDKDLRLRAEPGFCFDRSPNNYLIRRDLFLELGGYADPPSYCGDIPMIARIEQRIRRTIPQDRTAQIYVTNLTAEQGHHCRRPW